MPTRVEAEIPLPFGLQRLAQCRVGERRLDPALAQHLERGGVEVADQVAVGAGIGRAKP